MTTNETVMGVQRRTAVTDGIKGMQEKLISNPEPGDQERLQELYTQRGLMLDFQKYEIDSKNEDKKVLAKTQELSKSSA